MPTTDLAGVERFGLFEVFGVELELMIVDAETFDVRPICDQLIASVAGAPASEIEVGDIAWSNELTLHVLEIKTNGPAPSLRGLEERFHESVLHAERVLGPLGARLLPGAMHPWMDPSRETKLWRHEYTEVYHAYDRIFGCSGHGWANLQSTHINLPFSSDDEFSRLHAAIRIALPLIPALAAASPFQDGGIGPALDSRLVAYRGNARRIPSVAGQIVPEHASTRLDYERDILGRIYADLAPHDPEGILRHEWANARGAIARFDRGAIEIRIIDSQECPAADLAVVGAVAGLVRSLAAGRLSARDTSRDPSTEALAAVLDDAVQRGEEAEVRNSEILRTLGVRRDSIALRALWRELIDADPPDDLLGANGSVLSTILDSGPLARRLLRASGSEPTRDDLRRIAKVLCQCLVENTPFPEG
jgi:carboxylate-amine ligase